MGKKADKQPEAKPATKKPVAKKEPEPNINVMLDEEIDKETGSDDVLDGLNEANKALKQEDLLDEGKQDLGDEDEDDAVESDDESDESDGDGEDGIEKELGESAAEGSGDAAPEEDEEITGEPEIVLVPVSIRLKRDELVSWFKQFDGLDSYVIFTTSGDDFVEIIGLDNAHRVSVVSKLSNLESEALRKKLDRTAQIPLCNNKESITRHLNVIGASPLVDLIFDGKDLTVKSGDDESTFSPDARQVAPAASMKNIFKSEKKGEVLNALGKAYKNYMVFDKGFADIVSKWEKFGREYAMMIIDGKKVTCRFVEDVEDVDGKSGASIAVEPKKLVTSGRNMLGFTKNALVPMKKIVADDEIIIRYFSDDHPYIVNTKSGDTMMIVASTVKPSEEDEKE